MLLEKSLVQISDAARQVLALMGLLALAPFHREPIAAALGLSPNQLRKPLGELVSYRLLLHGEERYTVSHALVHTYARECCRPADEVTGHLPGTTLPWSGSSGSLARQATPAWTPGGRT